MKRTRKTQNLQKIRRYAVWSLTLLAILAVTAGLAVFAAGTVTPENGVYNVATGDQFISVMDGIKTGSVSANATIRLTADVDVDGKLPMLTTTFKGVLDGNGKAISGITNTMFKQFEGTVRDLTLHGTIDAAAISDFDTARKASSFAMNASSAAFENLISDVNITNRRNDLNAGGIAGYVSGGTSFINCAYNGTYTVEWQGDNAGVGGIAGWSNGTVCFERCSFGGTLCVTGGASGKQGRIGGILGYASNDTVTITNCYVTGTVESAITAGTDFVGGILGLNKKASTTLEFCANKATVKGAINAGGILGGTNDNLIITHCTNYVIPTGKTAGSVVGTGGDKTLRLENCADAASGSALKLSGTDSNNKNCYTSAQVQVVSDSLNVDSKEYVRYNFGVTEKVSGILAETLSTTDMFQCYFSLREEGTTQAIRFVILTSYRKIQTESVTVSILFKDRDGKTIKSLSKKLATENSDFELYSAVVADGEVFFADNDNALFGLVVTDIPDGAWYSTELSITDTKDGTVYYSPAAFSLQSLKLSLAELPPYTSMGSVAANIYNSGPGLMSDRNGTTAEDTHMVVISNTTAAKLADYVKTMEEAGFEKISHTELDGNFFYTYQKYGTSYYLYHTAKQGTTRIIADNSSDPLSAISYAYDRKPGDTIELYQYSLNYDIANKPGFDPVVYTESRSTNNGMCYLLKLPDNRLIMVDGGREEQSTPKSRKGLVDFMHQITGTPATEKVQIAAWFFTHAHNDHVRMASDIFQEYHDVVDLQTVICNFPSYQVISGNYGDNTFTLKANIQKYYPDVKFHKLHTGEQLSFAGVNIDVVYTHEDAVSNAGTTKIGDFNATSTVLKISFDGKTWMVLGDISSVAEDAIIDMHTKEYLKVDIVQVAHHGFNFLNKLYPAMGAKIALFPNSRFYITDPGNSQSNYYKYLSIMEYATEEYYAHKYITKLWVDENGAIQHQLLARYDQSGFGQPVTE